MIKDREELEVNIKDAVQKHNPKKKILRFISNQFSERGMQTGKVQDVWTQRKETETLTEVELYLLTKYLYEQTHENRINPTDYYTKVEIQDGDNYKEIKQENKINYPKEPLIFDNVIKVNDNQYLFIMEGKTLKDLNDSQIISYNFDTQRDPKYKTDNFGDLIKIANVNDNSVAEIAQDISFNKFISNTITLNLLADGNDEFQFIKNKLIIKSGQINIIDGFHRNLANIKALAENPNIDTVWEIRFTNWTVDKANNFIEQEDKRNKIDKRYMYSVIATDKWGNKVVKFLNNSDSDIAGRISASISLLKSGVALTLSDLMSDAIDELWTLKNNMEAKNLSEWLVEFFDYLLGTYHDEFTRYEQPTVIKYPAMFIGYVTLAHKIEGNTDWKSKLKCTIDSIDFSKDNTAWEEMGIMKANGNMSFNIKKGNLRAIISYFQKAVK